MTTQPFSETVTGIGPPWLLYDQVRMYNRGVARGKGRRAGEGYRLAPGGGSAVSRWVIGRDQPGKGDDDVCPGDRRGDLKILAAAGQSRPCPQTERQGGRAKVGGPAP